MPPEVEKTMKMQQEYMKKAGVQEPPEAVSMDEEALKGLEEDLTDLNEEEKDCVNCFFRYEPLEGDYCEGLGDGAHPDDCKPGDLKNWKSMNDPNKEELGKHGMTCKNCFFYHELDVKVHCDGLGTWPLFTDDCKPGDLKGWKPMIDSNKEEVQD